MLLAWFFLYVGMGSISSYVCGSCGAMFTRFSNGKRHNFNIHGVHAEILGTIQYLTGVSQGRYQPPPALLRRGGIGRPPTNGGQRRMPNFNYIIPGRPPEPLLNRVARDSMGDTSNSTFGVLRGQGQQYQSYLQQARAEPRQHMRSLLPSPTNQNVPAATPPDPMSQSHSQPMKDWGTLPQGFIQKIVELRRLLNRYPTTFPNPEFIIQGAKHFCIPRGQISIPS